MSIYVHALAVERHASFPVLFVFRCVRIQLLSVIPAFRMNVFQMPVERDVVVVVRDDVSDVVCALYL